jgi:hypothetical protein
MSLDCNPYGELISRAELFRPADVTEVNYDTLSKAIQNYIPSEEERFKNHPFSPYAFGPTFFAQVWTGYRTLKCGA